MNKKLTWEDVFFWCCIAFAVIAVLSSVLEPYSPIHFVNWETKNWYYQFILLSTPITVFLAKITHFIKHKRQGSVLVHFMAACFLSLLLFLSLIVYSFLSPETWINDEALYKHRFDKGKIVVRQHRSWDENRLVISRPFTKHFTLTTEVDSVDLHPYEWEKLDSYSDDLPDLLEPSNQ